ncbi:DEAD/DEAH box helicase family protein [Streptococcus anginosus]|uniref:DEAD/DEAH box helicase family protein n=1 Tax=Streptococcus anginosus TaxID=1328 RepID=UPI0019599F8D|nr:DEAD/DEAH box helicase family protein [Streptococcus anginosus]VTY23724.1 Type III restriction enzyme, res subunit [Streptococcus anginosus]
MVELQLRKWQAEAVRRSDKITNGIFLEAAGGRGKTICALAIAKHKKAKKVIITNNRLAILNGWVESIEKIGLKDIEFDIVTDRTLQNRVKKGEKLDCDVLIIDEWQNMSSEANYKMYKKIKRSYTIGLSATPIRKKGQNFYPLEKTVFGWATPNNKFDWQKAHGKMVYDRFSYSKEKWEDFRDYERYVSNLPNFFRWEEIEAIEEAEENNGFEVTFEPVWCLIANPTELEQFRQINVVGKNGKYAMAKQSFGRDTFERYLIQTGFEVDFPKLKAVNADTPMLLQLDLLLAKNKEMLIVSKSKQIVEIIYERHPEIGIWTGDRKEQVDKTNLVATSQVLGVGVDGLQHKFKTIVVLDPVQPGDGNYDDYRQLLWRVTGSRQQHDVRVIEFYF